MKLIKEVILNFLMLKYVISFFSAQQFLIKFLFILKDYQILGLRSLLNLAILFIDFQTHALTFKI